VFYAVSHFGNPNDRIFYLPDSSLQTHEHVRDRFCELSHLIVRHPCYLPGEITISGGPGNSDQLFYRCGKGDLKKKSQHYSEDYPRNSHVQSDIPGATAAMYHRIVKALHPLKSDIPELISYLLNFAVDLQ